MQHIRPPGAHNMNCWGRKFQDGDPECNQCRFKDSCRPAMMEYLNNPSDQRTSLPVLRPYSPSTPPVPPVPSMVPMPTRPYYPPPVASLPRPTPMPPAQQPQPQMPQVAQQPQQQAQHYQSTTGWSLPSTSNPNPMASMFRPGAQGPAYYFTQYPGESVAKRVGKNLVLRAAESIFGELMQFFRHWTWPPQ